MALVEQQIAQLGGLTVWATLDTVSEAWDSLRWENTDPGRVFTVTFVRKGRETVQQIAPADAGTLTFPGASVGADYSYLSVS